MTYLDVIGPIQEAILMTPKTPKSKTSDGKWDTDAREGETLEIEHNAKD